MHELSIAANLMDQLTRIAREQGAARIVEVEVRCGVMQQVVAEALATAFDVLSAETPAAGAQLRIVEVELAGACRQCGRRYEPRIDDFVCPDCGAADVALTAGDDIVLQSVVCEVEDKATA